MEILRTQNDTYLELSFEGRLDAYWAQHLASSVGEVMREGAHAVRLNLAKTTYISSAGIGILVSLYKQFAAVNGSFGVIEPSPMVKQILGMVGLTEMLDAAQTKPAPQMGTQPRVERQEADGAVFEIHDGVKGSELQCKLVGNPGGLASAGFSDKDSHGVAVTSGRLILGLGAFGDSYSTCNNRFGEFLAVAGAAACQPTDGANFPDYMVSSGTFVPRISALYGVCCEGSFAKLVRFESASGKDPVPLSRILTNSLRAAGADTAGVVIVAESAGLMGAVLKRPPVRNGDKSGKLFAFPEIRKWLSFSPERSFPRALAVICGIVSTNPPPAWKPFVRPLASGKELEGHLHAAAFAYRPLQKGNVEMYSTVRGLFEAGGLEGVLHLLSDDRNATAAGETELLRGACWIGPVKQTGAAEELL